MICGSKDVILLLKSSISVLILCSILSACTHHTIQLVFSPSQFPDELKILNIKAYDFVTLQKFSSASLKAKLSDTKGYYNREE